MGAGGEVRGSILVGEWRGSKGVHIGGGVKGEAIPWLEFPAYLLHYVYTCFHTPPPAVFSNTFQVRYISRCLSRLTRWRSAWAEVRTRNDRASSAD